MTEFGFEKGNYMSHIFHFEQLDQQCMEPRQGLTHLSTSASGNRSSLPTTAQLTRIFSAAICSLVMAFFFFILIESSVNDAVMAMDPLLTLGGRIILVGALLALGGILFAGVPLAVVVWRSTPRSRVLLTIPFLALVLPLMALILPFLRLTLFAVLLAGIPLTVIAWRSRPRGPFLFTIPFLTIVVPLVTLLFYQPRFASLVVLFADLLLTVAVWQLTPPPRIRFRLLIPFLAFALLLVTLNLGMFVRTLLGPFLFMGPVGEVIRNIFSYDLPIIGNLGNVLLVVLICGMPIISTIAINRAVRQARIPDKWLRFTWFPSRFVVFGLVLMFLGLLFWGFYLAIFAPALFFALLSPFNAPWSSWLLILVGMLISVIVAARALSSADATSV
jgi:hypothetical protein